MRNFIIIAVVILLYNTGCGTANSTERKNSKADILYACLPCGSSCDTATFNKPGTCRHCNMELVDKSTIKHKNIQPEQICLVNQKKVIFLDVRTTGEFNGTARDKFGAIKNAVNIPVQELQARIKELEPYKDREIVVYCSHSHRSPRASYMLTQGGFKNVTNMDGGMSVWKARVNEKECNDKLYQQQ